jgi:hypothetical protein
MSQPGTKRKYSPGRTKSTLIRPEVRKGTLFRPLGRAEKCIVRLSAQLVFIIKYEGLMRAYSLVFGYRIFHEYQSLLSELEPRIWQGHESARIVWILVWFVSFFSLTSLARLLHFYYFSCDVADSSTKFRFLRNGCTTSARGSDRPELSPYIYQGE